MSSYNTEKSPGRKRTKGEQIGDPLHRPYAGYDCVNCGRPVVWRHNFWDDECQGCGAHYQTTAPIEWIQEHLR